MADFEYHICYNEQRAKSDSLYCRKGIDWWKDGEKKKKEIRKLNILLIGADVWHSGEGGVWDTHILFSTAWLKSVPPCFLSCFRLMCTLEGTRQFPWCLSPSAHLGARIQPGSGPAVAASGEWVSRLKSLPLCIYFLSHFPSLLFCVSSNNMKIMLSFKKCFDSHV